ncbi:hypothetical protein HZH68_016145 [Vespula germanica]|uniref:Uncharacterized protein n=1 Tax=Vespula germanica TaxID=30212 RepID=A0A834MQE2_VESGE|nr:hypothetical protein HZH68_016145 [Vespula germanica]
MYGKGILSDAMSKHVTKGRLEMVELGEERGRIQIKCPMMKMCLEGDFLFWRRSREFYFMEIWTLGPRTSEHERSYENSAVNRYFEHEKIGRNSTEEGQYYESPWMS